MRPDERRQTQKTRPPQESSGDLFVTVTNLPQSQETNLKTKLRTTGGPDGRSFKACSAVFRGPLNPSRAFAAVRRPACEVAAECMQGRVGCPPPTRAAVERVSTWSDQKGFETHCSQQPRAEGRSQPLARAVGAVARLQAVMSKGGRPAASRGRPATPLSSATACSEYNDWKGRHMMSLASAPGTGLPPIRAASALRPGPPASVQVAVTVLPIPRAIP